MSEAHKLQLFVTGRTPLAERSERNLRQLCMNFLDGTNTVEVIDVLEHPDLAASENIFATPTLIATKAKITRRLIGDFSDKAMVLQSLRFLTEDDDSAG